MQSKIFCPYCSDYCTITDSLLFYDNHSTYGYSDYFLPMKYREHFQKYKENEKFENEIIAEAKNNYSIVCNEYHFDLDDDYAFKNEKLRLIDLYEMQFYKPVFKINGIIFHFKKEDTYKYNHKLPYKESNLEYIKHKQFKREQDCLHGAIYRPSFSHRIDINLNKGLFNEEIAFVYLINDEFSINIFNDYLSRLPPRVITMIRLFIGSTKYMIRNIMERNFYFIYMDRFNKKYLDKANKNFQNKQLNAKEYIPTKYQQKKP